MEQGIVAKVRNNPKYQQLVKKRSAFAWTLSAIICLIYYGFILVIAFKEKIGNVLGTPLSEGSITTIGIPIGVLVILSAFLLTGIYVWRANSEFDRLTREIKDEVR
ncbi:MAG: hypothetical protein BWK79_18155 [Beggiatoa sp. IS2]|nr:MAG: hypothetical protein BWK79_18155 [Beggiatoa sp. IS2]